MLQLESIDTNLDIVNALKNSKFLISEFLYIYAKFEISFP